MFGLKRFVDWLMCYDSYKLKDRVIHRKEYPFREETLPVDEIETYTIYPEMVFDVVKILRKDGKVRTWFDTRGDLTEILHTALPAKEINPERDLLSERDLF